MIDFNKDVVINSKEELNCLLGFYNTIKSLKWNGDKSIKVYPVDDYHLMRFMAATYFLIMHNCQLSSTDAEIQTFLKSEEVFVYSLLRLIN